MKTWVSKSWCHCVHWRHDESSTCTHFCMLVRFSNFTMSTVTTPTMMTTKAMSLWWRQQYRKSWKKCVSTVQNGSKTIQNSLNTTWKHSGNCIFPHPPCVGLLDFVLPRLASFLPSFQDPSFRVSSASPHLSSGEVGAWGRHVLPASSWRSWSLSSACVARLLMVKLEPEVGVCRPSPLGEVGAWGWRVLPAPPPQETTRIAKRISRVTRNKKRVGIPRSFGNIFATSFPPESLPSLLPGPRIYLEGEGGVRVWADADPDKY